VPSEKDVDTVTRFIGPWSDVEADPAPPARRRRSAAVVFRRATEMVPDDRIAAVFLETPGPDTAGRALINLALEAGGTR
jgi:hypothetical protein